MTVCQMMLFERVIGSRCCFQDAAEAVPQQIKLMVNTSLETLRPSQVVETHFVTLQLA